MDRGGGPGLTPLRLLSQFFFNTFAIFFFLKNPFFFYTLAPSDYRNKYSIAF